MASFLKVSVLVLTLLFSQFSFAQTQTWSYKNTENKVSKLKIFDNPNTLGEERVELISKNQTLASQSVTVSKDSYEANIVLTNASGDVITDLSASVSFGESYAQIVELLKDEKFAKTFDFLANDCGDKAQGFLMINNNLDMTMTGHCLY